jgi:Coenzyme PQQ synthesis protein D (PqqD)
MVAREFSADSILYVDPDTVVHDTIDGETVVVALETGTYYTITGSGVDMWSIVSGQAGFTDAIVCLQTRFPAQSDRIPAQFEEWLEQMLAEGLVQVRIGTDAPSASLAIDDSAPYELPGLVRFDDLQSLILLDPIHEADVHAGWPHRP